MFQIEDMTEVHVASVTNRTEMHGDERVPAVSIAVEMECANTTLDIIDPKIREALYKAVEGQEDLPGIERSTPVLRCNSFDRCVLTTAHEGWTLAVDDGVDASKPMTFGSVKVDKMSVDGKQGGTILLRFRMGTSDVDAEKLGKLAMHNGQAMWITLLAPKPGQEPIDGTVGHPGAAPDAGDLFSAGHGPDDDDAESEGGETDAAPAIDNSREAKLQRLAGVTIERSQPGTRTARGLERTRKALDDGKAAADAAHGTH